MTNEVTWSCCSGRWSTVLLKGRIICRSSRLGSTSRCAVLPSSVAGTIIQSSCVGHAL